MKILKTLINVGFVLIFMLRVMLKYEIIVISLENIEALHKEIVMPMLNYTIYIVFYNLKNNDSHLIMLELGKFNLKINVIPNGVQKNMSFNINNKLRFIDTF